LGERERWSGRRGDREERLEDIVYKVEIEEEVELSEREEIDWRDKR
jgi:hypothetical protein